MALVAAEARAPQEPNMHTALLACACWTHEVHGLRQTGTTCRLACTQNAPDDVLAMPSAQSENRAS